VAFGLLHESAGSASKSVAGNDPGKECNQGFQAGSFATIRTACSVRLWSTGNRRSIAFVAA
jgi:hypothetical protein